MTQSNRPDILRELDRILVERRGADPESSYVASLYAAGLNRILEKVGEEATEVVLAAKDNAAGESTDDSTDESAENADAVVGEVADLWFHTLVLLAQQELTSQDVLDCLAERFGLSGLSEKAARAQ